MACKNNLISEELPLSTTCELVACKIHLAHHYLIVCSLYRPPDRNLPYLEELCRVLKQIILTNPNAIIWFSGDLNLLNIDWNLNCLQGNNYPSTLCMTFLDTLLELDLSQIVTFPTRQRNILDIFITNHPTLVKSCTSIPEISDHEAVCVLSNIISKVHKSIPNPLLQSVLYGISLKFVYGIP